MVCIATAAGSDAEWCAQLMASSEPWIALGRAPDACRAAIARPGTELHVAREGGEPVGFVLVAPYGFAASPYLASIAVEPGHRGRGIGSELMAFVEHHFADREHLFLLVSSFNTRAQALYRRRGYERVGELADYLTRGASEVILHKHLP
jgi:ribosomal protein S18 acetylase RimI-like enzyme